MMFVILHHFIRILPNQTISPAIISSDILFHSAASCFIIISGYYGIQFRLIKLLEILLFVVFYSVLLCLYAKYQYNITTWKDIIKCFLPVTNGYYWYIAIYIQLYIFAPFLNILLNKIDNKRFCFLLTSLFFLVYYIGIIRTGDTGFVGKHLQNFILLYCIGNGLKRITLRLIAYKKTIRCSTMLTICIIPVIAFISICLFNYLWSYISLLFEHYHSLGLILISIALFLFFLTFSFTNKIVNHISKSSLAIYLFHEHPFMSNYIYKDFFSSLSIDRGMVIIYLALGTMLIMVVAVFIDQIRMFSFKLILPFISQNIILPMQCKVRNIF